MKLWLQADDIEVEISDKRLAYSPDVLEDWCHRANELMVQQRAATVALDSDVLGGDGEALS